MDPLSLATVGALYVATSVARKAGDDLIDETWTAIKKAFKSVFGREPAPTEISAAKIESVVADNPELEAALSRLWAGAKVLRRARMIEPVLTGARILWVDDHPEWNVTERECMDALGMSVLTVESTRSAIASLKSESFDLVLSDVAREESPTAGIEAIPQLRSVAADLPIVLYVGELLPGVPEGAFGITARPDELLHLCMDVLERRRT
jgi:CheY-like chemotaxis protein